MRNSRIIPVVAFVLGVLFLIQFYYPLLSPLMDPKLQFASGDLITIAGENSGSMRKEISFYTFAGGRERYGTNRFFLVGGLSAISDFIYFSDTQFTSALIAIAIILGSLGIFKLVRHFEKNDLYSAALTFLLILFYFLNLWSVERLGHLWIWLTYAIFPLFAYFGIAYLEEKKMRQLVLYSLVFGFFGFLPHSFLYLLIIHLALSAYAALRSGRISARFLLLPLGIYSLLNLPSFLIAGYVGMEYPIEVTGESLGYLSNNGELINLLAFSNNWWHQFPDTIVFNNFFFRYSSMTFFFLVFLVFILTYDRLERKEKWMALIFMAAILGVMFLAQGSNSPLLSDILLSVSEAGYAQLLGPMREWARIGILIPVFLISIFSIGIARTDRKRVFLAAFAILLFINILFTPGKLYLNRIYAAVYISDDFAELREMIGWESKVLWTDVYERYVPAQTQWGEHKDIRRPLPNGIGSPYFYSSKIRDAPSGLLEKLNVNYAIEISDDSGLGFWGCREMDSLTVCKSGREPQPFRIYDGTVLSGEDRLFSFAYAPMDNLAASSAKGDFIEYDIVDEIGWNGSRTMHLFEAESDFEGDLLRKDYRDASGGAVAIAAELSKSFDIAGDGDYRIALRGKGHFDVTLSNISMELVSGSLDFVYSDPIRMEEGQYMLKIMPEENASLDAVWIYSYDEVLESYPEAAHIIDYTRVDPTLWRIKINASRPFMLGFAESYSPLWEARIHSDGSKAVKPVRLYGVMNGYWIEEAGMLDIELRHVPQDAFEAGFPISALTLMACLAYLIVGVKK